MKTRILSGLVMVPLLAVVYFGGYLLLAACFLVAVVGVHEFIKGFTALGYHGSRSLAWLMTVLLYGFHLADRGGLLSFGTDGFLKLWFFLTILLSFLPLFQIEKRQLEDAMVTITGIFYVVFFSYHVYLIAEAEPAVTGSATGRPLLLWLVFLTAFGTDIMAYFSGYAFGKHKLCPTISPKKTIEGSIGGTLGSVILCGVFGYLLLPQLLLHCLLIGLLGGIVSQFGDLTASIFKRKMGIKDYGNLIPGHGGIMDRFDSVLFTAPLVYYYMELVLL